MPRVIVADGRSAERDPTWNAALLEEGIRNSRIRTFRRQGSLGMGHLVPMMKRRIGSFAGNHTHLKSSGFQIFSVPTSKQILGSGKPVGSRNRIAGVPKDIGGPSLLSRGEVGESHLGRHRFILQIVLEV